MSRMRLPRVDGSTRCAASTANEFGITANDVAVEQDNRGLAKGLLQAGAVPTVFSETAPPPGWYTAQSHVFAADYYEAEDRALANYRMAEKHYAGAIEEWRGDARKQNSAIAGAVFSSLLIEAVTGTGAATPSIYDPIKARAHAGRMRQKADARFGINQRKVLELGGDRVKNAGKLREVCGGSALCLCW